MASVMNFMTLLDIEYFQTLYYPELQDHIIDLFIVNLCRGYIFPPHFDLPEDVWTNVY